MEKDFLLTVLGLDELRELGYNEVWIGNVPNPHWQHGCNNFVIASPKRKIGGWPAVWSAKKFGKQSCGNGLSKADQAQMELARRMISGYYRLTEGSWDKIEG